MALLEWATENWRTFVWAGIGIMTLGALSFLRMGIQDWRSRRTADRDSQYLLAGIGLAPEPAIAPSPMLSEEGWRGWKTRTMPRYAEVPTVGREVDRLKYLGRHSDTDELIGASQEPPTVVEEHEEGYIGRHRLPETADASYLQALMTQTREFPALRTLSATWRLAG